MLDVTKMEPKTQSQTQMHLTGTVIHVYYKERAVLMVDKIESASMQVRWSLLPSGDLKLSNKQQKFVKYWTDVPSQPHALHALACTCMHFLNVGSAYNVTGHLWAPSIAYWLPEGFQPFLTFDSYLRLCRRRTPRCAERGPRRAAVRAAVVRRGRMHSCHCLTNRADSSGYHCRLVA